MFVASYISLQKKHYRRTFTRQGYWNIFHVHLTFQSINVPIYKCFLPNTVSQSNATIYSPNILQSFKVVKADDNIVIKIVYPNFRSISVQLSSPMAFIYPGHYRFFPENIC